MSENMRRRIEETYFDLNNKIKLTCSFGVVEINKDMKKFDDVLIESDRLLYIAKAGGRNKIRS